MASRSDDMTLDLFTKSGVPRRKVESNAMGTVMSRTVWIDGEIITVYWRRLDKARFAYDPLTTIKMHPWANSRRIIRGWEKTRRGGSR